MCAAVVAAGIVSLSAGCAPPAGPKTASVQSASMPSGASWTGVYFSELFGNLHLKSQGSSVVGRWIRPVKDRWGELKGEANGDVLRFEWKEHVIGGVGPKSLKTGHGYFKYKRPAGDNVDDQIFGEVGDGEDEVGLPWEAGKQRNVQVDLESIGGSGASDIGGGDWDGPNKESGSAEPPAAPPSP
jgi:hypothetical protein